MEVLEKIRKCGIVPVVAIERLEDAKPLAEALKNGGLNCIEVTFRTAVAADAIQIMKDTYPEITVGAGTVLTIEQVEQARKAGAEFIVSPGSNPRVIQYCLEKKICIIPGIMTPSEIEKNLELGLTVMKFFPAEPAGGVAFLKAVHGPYPMVEFMPTGGINPKNVRDYLAQDFIVACGGSWMVKPSLMQDRSFEEICVLAKQSAEIVKDYR